MASVRGRRRSTPRRQRHAPQISSGFTFEYPVTSQFKIEDASVTPAPLTPALGWAETPPAAADPPTPEDGFDFGGSGPLSPSPLAVRKSHVEQKHLAISYYSQLESDVNEHLHPILPSELGRNKRLFKEEISNLSRPAVSPIQRHPSNNPASAVPSPVVKIEADEEGALGAASRTSPSIIRTAARCHDTKGPNTVTASSAAISTGASTYSRQAKIEVSPAPPSSCLTEKPHMPLALVWDLSTKLSKILPIDAMERLKEDHGHNKCVSTTTQGQRCKNKNAAKLDENAVTELCKTLSLLERPYQFEACTKHIELLLEQVHCRGSHLTPAKNQWTELCSYSWTTSEIVGANAQQAKFILNTAMSIFQLWLLALTNFAIEAEDTTVPVKEDAGGVQEVLNQATNCKAIPQRDQKSRQIVDWKPEAVSCLGNRIVTESTTRTPVAARRWTGSKSGRRSTHLYYNFQDYPWSEKEKNLAAEEMIRRNLLRQLTPGDIDRYGFIYRYWNPGSFHYIKIGYSIKVDRRLREWQRKCGFSLAKHENDEDTDNQMVRHVLRVESLIHAELKEYRRYEPYCSGCGKSHLEWFEVSPDYAKKVVEKWTKRSYYSNGLLEASLTQADIDKLCEITPKEVTVILNSENPRKSLGHYHQRRGRKDPGSHDPHHMRRSPRR